MQPHARDRMFAILFLIALNPLFWGLFEQAGGSMNLYTDRFVDRAGVPASLFQSINPIYIVLLGAIVRVAVGGAGQARARTFGPGQVRLGLVPGRSRASWSSCGAPIWSASSVMTPVIFVFLHLSAAHHRRIVPVAGRPQRDEPARAEASGASLIMGAWFYMTAVGNFVAGKIGEATGGEGGEMTKELTLAIYSKIGWITIGVSVGGPRAVAVGQEMDASRHAEGRSTLAGQDRLGRAAGGGNASRAGNRSPYAAARDAAGGA